MSMTVCHSLILLTSTVLVSKGKGKCFCWLILCLLTLDGPKGVAIHYPERSCLHHIDSSCALEKGACGSRIALDINILFMA